MIKTIKDDKNKNSRSTMKSLTAIFSESGAIRCREFHFFSFPGYISVISRVNLKLYRRRKRKPSLFL